jgi:hypothetical protein
MHLPILPLGEDNQTSYEKLPNINSDSPIKDGTCQDKKTFACWLSPRLLHRLKTSCPTVLKIHYPENAMKL